MSKCHFNRRRIVHRRCSLCYICHPIASFSYYLTFNSYICPYSPILVFQCVLISVELNYRVSGRVRREKIMADWLGVQLHGHAYITYMYTRTFSCPWELGDVRTLARSVVEENFFVYHGERMCHLEHRMNQRESVTSTWSVESGYERTSISSLSRLIVQR